MASDQGNAGGSDLEAPRMDRRASVVSNASNDDDFAEAQASPVPESSSPALDSAANIHQTADLDKATKGTLEPAAAAAVATGTAEQSGSTTAAKPSGLIPLTPSSEHLLDGVDPDSSSFVLVAQLRSQITDLTSQVTSLNTKLVRSYTTNGDLEDELHDTRERETLLKRRCQELEKDSARWQREVEGGGWVERQHVQGEMQRLMSKVLEETKTRETAVEAHTALETEIDSLTSQLFDEANKMVAVERIARARADEKLRSLEESGQTMQALFEEVQVNLRDTVGELETKDKQISELRSKLSDAGIELDSPQPGAGPSDIVVSDGNTVRAVPASKGQSSGNAALQLSSSLSPPRLLNSVLPFYEFLAFVQYLRQLRTSVLTRPLDSPSYGQYGSAALVQRTYGQAPSNASTAAYTAQHYTPPSPAQLLAPHLSLSTHLAQPFVKRCVEEDSDPSLRLDVAPGLGFLSRRTVGTAVVDGTLLIEPLSAGAELPTANCALCGTALERWARGASVAKATGTAAGVAGVNSTMKKVLGGGGWSFSNLTGKGDGATSKADKNAAPAPTPIKTSLGGGATSTEPLSFAAAYGGSVDPNHFVHIFRVGDNASTRYAVCPTYCLPRLRAVCEFWTYIRVIERGLLLEEGFRFVKGRGEDDDGNAPKGGMASARASVEGLGLSGASTSASASASASASKLDVSTVSEEKAEESTTGLAEETNGEEPYEKDGAADIDNNDEKKAANSAEPTPSTSPTIATSPALTSQGNDSSSSVNKPPVPRRSAARAHGSTTPSGAEISGASSPAVREEAQASYTASVDEATMGGSPVAPNGSAPLLPPRPPPRHAATTPKAIAEQMPSSLGEFVGSSSNWEDRCWAEVVRLKENVFWTRVAAVRHGSSSG